jgi:hypothetical protein
MEKAAYLYWYKREQTVADTHRERLYGYFKYRLQHHPNPIEEKQMSVSQDRSLQNQRALVTGATSGIGRAIAL